MVSFMSSQQGKNDFIELKFTAHRSEKHDALRQKGPIDGGSQER